MRRISGILMCGVSAVACSGAAYAQQASVNAGQSATAAISDPQEPQADSTGVSDPAQGDIIVTARRKGESLQDVPSTVQAVSGESLEKLAITQFQDVASVVPGLTLGSGNLSSGNAPAPSIRGVSYDVAASPSPTVDIYVNEVPTDSPVAFQAIYDLAGVQVLRGPQGTLRGRTAPSGAILLSTRKADLNEAGGYVSMLATQKGSVNGQAALSVPILTDVLALRVAGVVDQNDGNFVKSAPGGVSPYRNTESVRANLVFQPASNLDLSATYQFTHNDSRQYNQAEGPGSAGGVIATAPANFNGPPIRASQRLAAGESPRFSSLRVHQLTGAINWSVLGHTISYVGGYTKRTAPIRQALDLGNQVRGDYFQELAMGSMSESHEVRVASANTGGIFNYTLGYFHSYSKNSTLGSTFAAFQPGAFGSPGSTANPALFDPRFSINTLINSRSRNIEDSFFGSATLKLGRSTELTGGVRYIVSSQKASTSVLLGTGLLARALPVPCAAAGFSSTYPGFCDVPLTFNLPIGGGVSDARDTPLVYNASLSHRFSEDVLAYATVGSSWRRGGNNFFISNAEKSPVLAALTFLPNEKSTSYEAGLKMNFLDRRLRINVAGFYQKFSNLNFQSQSVPYVAANGSNVTLDNFSVNNAADAIVKGFDIDVNFAVTPNWSLGIISSYADGRIDNQEVPCRDANFDGVPDAGRPTLAQFRARGIYLAQCKSKASVSRDPLWSATAQSELRQPVGQVEAYVRGLATYYPKNGRRNAGSTVPDYVLANLYAGIRSPDGAWDLGLFARNLLNTGVRTSLEPNQFVPAGNLIGTFGATGYSETSYTPPFEAGVSVRFAFGSR